MPGGASGFSHQHPATQRLQPARGQAIALPEPRRTQLDYRRVRLGNLLQARQHIRRSVAVIRPQEFHGIARAERFPPHRGTDRFLREPLDRIRRRIVALGGKILIHHAGKPARMPRGASRFPDSWYYHQDRGFRFHTATWPALGSILSNTEVSR